MAAGPQRQRPALRNLLGRLRRGHPGEVNREGHGQHAQQQHGVGQQRGQRAAFDHPYCTLRSTRRNWATVNAITITISTTDCAAEPPMSSALKPS